MSTTMETSYKEHKTDSLIYSLYLFFKAVVPYVIIVPLAISDLCQLYESDAKYHYFLLFYENSGYYMYRLRDQCLELSRLVNLSQHCRYSLFIFLCLILADHFENKVLP